MSESDSQNRSEAEGYVSEATSLTDSSEEIEIVDDDVLEVGQAPHPSREEPEVSSLLRLVVPDSGPPRRPDYLRVSHV